MDTVWQFLTLVLAGLLGILIPIGLTVLWKRVEEVRNRFKTQSPYLYSKIMDVAELVVKAAEQAKLAGLIEDKKEYAIRTAEAWLEKEGIKVDLDILDSAIEAAVFKFFSKKEESKIGFTGVQ